MRRKMKGTNAHHITAIRAALDRARLKVVSMMQQREPLREILAVLATTAESLGSGRTVASILLLDEQGLLRNGASPNLPADYLDAIDRLRPDPEVGTCAAAAATGRIVITPDFMADTRWAELRHLPMALGFFSAWSVPIKSENRVLGTFGTYFRERRGPTEHEQEVVGSLAAVASAAIVADRTTVHKKGVRNLFPLPIVAGYSGKGS